VRSDKPLDPSVHPTAPERAAAWHAMMIRKIVARKTWPVLARHLLFDLRACPVCRLPVFRWKTWKEIRRRVLWAAVQAMSGQISLVSRRLKMSPHTLYAHLPTKFRERLIAEKPKPEGGAPQ
jgi:hypothetical protein